MRISLEATMERLLAVEDILITAHVNPDGDAIGSSLALMGILKQYHKKVRVLIDDDIPAVFSVLPDCALIHKPEEHYQADLLVVLDTSLDRLGAVLDHVTVGQILNIDHHISNDEKADWLYLDAERAATAEIVFQLLQLTDMPLTLDVAYALYTGIATDSGFFRYSNTTPFTMRAAARLLDVGVQPHRISEAMEQKPYALVQGMAAAMQTIELFSGGKIAGLFLNQALTESIDSTEGFIDFVRVIEGVDVAVLLKCKEEKLCRVSMRSKATDVSKIAMQFQGGGHVRAAGCTLFMPFEDAKKTILQALFDAMKESA